MATAAEELPQDVWVQILQHVPCKRRLSACALVCQKLARAAAAATQSLDLSFWNSPQHHDAFLGWASSQGHSLTKLCLYGSPSPIQQLACPNLLELELYECSVQLCAGSGHVGLLHSCTGLTSLYLRETPLLDGAVTGPAGAAPAATARLQHLELCFVECEGAQAVQTRLFPHLTDLTCLDVAAYDLDDELLSCFPPHISNMASLQQLRLSSAGPNTATTLPGIERLTALKGLELTCCDLESSTLQSMTTGLTRLCLEGVSLQPKEAQHDSALGTSQLLQLLGRCSALQKLKLDSISGNWPQQLSAHSALTASSNPQELEINQFDVEGAGWAHVFPAGRQLPQLYWFSAGGYGGAGHAPMGSADIARLVSCCPAVKDLVFTPAADASLAPLQSLTALTRLYIGSVSPAAISSGLTALTQLQELRVSVSLPAAGAGEDESSGLQHLVPLTSLTGLVCLSSRAVWLSSTAPAGSAPNVWVQLLEKCATDPAAQPAVISSVVRQLQQQREQVAQQAAEQQGQELAAARMAAVAAAAEAAELRERVQALEGRQEQKLAAARAEAAELRGRMQAAEGRVQALEGQLQEVLAALRHQMQS